MSDHFPPEFSELELFGGMAHPTEADRVRAKLQRPYSELKALYDAVLPRLDEILAYLGKFQLDGMSAEAERLLWLILSLADVAPAVEWWQDHYPPSHDEPVPVQIFQ